MKNATTPASRWHAGPPPHVGWWNASIAQKESLWRWWNGTHWSPCAHQTDNANTAAAVASHMNRNNAPILWTDYWPEGARVPRVDPANRWIAPMLPALNAGSMFAWNDAEHRMEVAARSKEWATWALSREPDPTPEEDEAWRALSTGQSPAVPTQTPESRELASVSTRALMTELFRRLDK